MHRNIYVGLLVIPLLIALCLLLIAVQTEYWTQLDYSKIKPLDNTNYDTNKYQVKKVKFEFPKYTSLFGECDEFKTVDILIPINDPYQAFNSKPTSVEINDDQLPQRSNDHDRNGCISKDECSRLNQEEQFSCFCCDRKNQTFDTCCFIKSYLCDGVSNCMDKSDEFENCPIRKLYYANRYVDNKHKCLRHQYNLLTFFRKVISRNFTDKNDVNSDFCLKKLLKSSSYSVKIFVLRVITLMSLASCVLFTILCFISIIFVTCCNDLRTTSESNGHLASEEDFEISTASSRKKCCKCNCFLCPFVFYSVFSFFALLSCLISLCVYFYSLCYVRNAYLVFDPEFIPEHISQAYQYNAWLFSIQQFGVSFYLFLAAFSLYLLVFILSTCFSCRIQLSPEWRNRHVNSYEVLQMHDMVLNTNGKKVDSKSFYKKMNKENKANEKEAKRIGKKYKNKEKNEDGFSFSEESNALTSPKTRLAAMDDSYE